MVAKGRRRKAGLYPPRVRVHLYQGSNSLAPRQTNSRRPRPLPRRCDVYGCFCTLSYRMRPTFVAMRWAGLPPSRQRPYYKLRTAEGKRAVATGIFIYTDRGGAGREKSKQTKKGDVSLRSATPSTARRSKTAVLALILFISIAIVATAFLNERGPATPDEATKNISPWPTSRRSS